MLFQPASDRGARRSRSAAARARKRGAERTAWTRARTYFSELLESYPQSPLRADAKLGVGDTFLGENNSASYVYAQNEYREFLAFYPTNPRADYAQMQLGMVHFNQMLNPQRDQTETREAIKEFQVFVDRYPNSKLITEVKQRLRESKDRLSDADMVVANFYLSIRFYAGASRATGTCWKRTPTTPVRTPSISIWRKRSKNRIGGRKRCPCTSGS